MSQFHQINFFHHKPISSMAVGLVIRMKELQKVTI